MRAESPAAGDKETESQIVEYAKRVASPGFFLGPIDAYLFSMKHEKKLLIMADLGAELELVDIKDYLKVGLESDGLAGLSDSLPAPSQSESETTWVCVGCNALYERDGRVNHWLPGFLKSELSSQEWFDLTVDLRVESSKKMKKLEADLAFLVAQEQSMDQMSPFEQTALVSKKDEVERKLLRQRNWQVLASRCALRGVAIVDVPGDGDCMVWALRCLFLGFKLFLAQPTECTSSQQQQAQTRYILKQMWTEVRLDYIWQVLFQVWCPEHATGEVIETPPRRLRAKTKVDVNSPAKMTTVDVKKVGDGRSAQTMHPPSSSKLELKLPGPAKQASVLEPAVPDVQSMFHRQQLQQPSDASAPPGKKGEEETMNVDEDEDILDEQALAAGAEKARQRHKRRFKSRMKTERELRLEDIHATLAEAGLEYHHWLSAHRAAALIPKACACPDGGWVALKAKFLKQEEPKCKVCLQILADFGLSVASLPDRAALPEASLPEAEHEETEEKEKNERELCLELIRSHAPVLELINPETFTYRCKVCVSRTQPDGKVNKLVKPKLSLVKFLLNQHLNCSTHKAKMMQAQAKEKMEKQGEIKMKAPCQGFRVGKSAEGRFAGRVEEFQLWATHSNLSASWVRHKYSCDLNSGEWTVKHHRCQQEVELCGASPEQACCQHCSSLNGHGGLLNRVVHFAEKYNAALLLRWRLFGSADEVDQFVANVSESGFGSHHAVKWKKLNSLTNQELQQLVRKMWRRSGREDLSVTGLAFYGSVVDPCLKVHATAIHSSTTALSSQLLDALSAQKQDEPCFFFRFGMVCHVLYGFVMLCRWFCHVCCLCLLFLFHYFLIFFI